MRLLRVLLVVVAVAIATLHGQVDSPPNINIQDEGTPKGSSRTVNCIGSGITCDVVSGIATVTSSGGGSGNFLDVTVNLSPATLGNTLTWTGYQVGSVNWNDVTWSPDLGLFVAVGNTENLRVATSPDGKVWTLRTAAENNSWNSVAWSPSLGLFAAVSTNGTNRVMTSPDGITWTPQTAASVDAWGAITWSPELGLFAAVGSTASNDAMTSDDGVLWTARALTGSSSNWQSIVWSPELDLFVAVGDDGGGGQQQVATSPDGIAWTLRTEADDSTWNDVTWSPALSLFVAVGSGGSSRIMTSSNGIAWAVTTDIVPLPSSLSGVAWSPELGEFIAVGGATSASQVYRSTDGLAWLPRQAAEANFWSDITWSPELGIFAAVATTTNGPNKAMISTGYGNLPGLVYTVTVTGQAWVAADSRILCNPFGSTTDGLTPETVFASGVQAVASNRVVGVGFDLTVYTPHGASGTYRFHCTGS